MNSFCDSGLDGGGITRVGAGHGRILNSNGDAADTVSKAIQSGIGFAGGNPTGVTTRLLNGCTHGGGIGSMLKLKLAELHDADIEGQARENEQRSDEQQEIENQVLGWDRLPVQPPSVSYRTKREGCRGVSTL